LPATPATSAASAAVSIPLPDDRKMDWSALVDTATKAISYSDEEDEDAPTAAAAAAAASQPRKVSRKSTVILNKSGPTATGGTSEEDAKADAEGDR
jgi:hypothetical protein